VNFFTKFKFFADIKSNNGETPIKAIMKFINIEEIPKGRYLIEEGEEGDKFYIILKGSCIVHKAIETEIPNSSLHPEKKVEIYLQTLWQNKEKI